jgi:hypothetical protein
MQQQNMMVQQHSQSSVQMPYMPPEHAVQPSSKAAPYPPDVNEDALTDMNVARRLRDLGQKRPPPAIVVDEPDANPDYPYKHVDPDDDSVPIMLDVPQRSMTKKSTSNRKSIWQFGGWWEIQELWRRRTVVGRKGTVRDRYAGAAV